ncbi:hypothetical protein [uncultured Sphingomonas sp.]|uniref:hypothetical protein n=1 Tax=uncultured Sphingomonas sp. TaxID=158754 RepID=UPI0030D744BB
MRLADDLARRRLCYPRPLPTLPDLCVIDVPAAYASATLPLGRYYPVIIETDREWCEWDAFLHAERDAPVAPDLLDRRASALIASEITFAHYDPIQPGWSWILLCRRPTEHIAVAGDHGDLFARSAYTIKVTADPVARTKMQERLFASLDRHGMVEIVIVPPSRLGGSS